MSMIFVVLNILIQAGQPSRSVPLCEVGRAALRDLPLINHNLNIPSYYGDFKPGQPNLLTRCPQLKHAIPDGYPPADDASRARANGAEQGIGEAYRPPAALYSVGIPELSADGRHATVSLGYSCTGLCGAAYIARYVRTRRGWVRDGKLNPMMVS